MSQFRNNPSEFAPFLKLSLVLGSILLLGACATSKERFPEFSEHVKSHKTVGVVLDLFVYQDIAGFDRGVDSEVRAETVAVVTDKINEIILARGYTPEVITVLEGATYEFESKNKYVISHDWKSTGEEYIPVSDKEGVWYSDSTRDFLAHLVEVAKEVNWQKGVKQQQAEATIAAKSDSPILKLLDRELDPTLFNNIDEDVLLFVKIEGRFQKLGKYITRGLLVGGISDALTGGLVVVPPGSYATAEIVALDMSTRSILWHGRGWGEFNNSFPYAINTALSQYPFQDGDTQWDKDRKLRKLKRVR